MKFQRLLNNRSSCRSFSDKPVSEEHIEYLLWVGERAPYASGGPRREIIAIGPEFEYIKHELLEPCRNQQYVAEAGVIFVGCSIQKDIPGQVMLCGNDKGLCDVLIGLSYIDIAAQSLGLGTCFIGNFDAEAVREVVVTVNKPEMILIAGYKGE